LHQRHRAASAPDAWQHSLARGFIVHAAEPVPEADANGKVGISNLEPLNIEASF